MSLNKPKPILPAGNASVWSGISENFSFHSSPEAFLSNAILQHHREHADAVSRRRPVRAKILNRNVVIVSSYRQILQVLDADAKDGSAGDDGDDGSIPAYVAGAPYARLMEPFFPPPNVLLADGCPHATMRKAWEVCARDQILQRGAESINRISQSFWADLPKDCSIDLYETMKDMAWRIFLSTFLDLNEDDEPTAFADYVKLQEELLRGQFSLVPVSINTGFWHSPRKVGIEARKKLQQVLSERITKQMPSWLSGDKGVDGRPEDEIVSHLLMATSSLAVKAFASLTTALLLNAYVFRGKADTGNQQGILVDWMNSGSVEDCVARKAALLQETLRLSPPIVGVMRRSTSELHLAAASSDEPDILVPERWDAWTYFPGGNRDAAVFGEEADLFQPARYLDASPEAPLAFGAGPKTCLGSRFTQSAALTVLDSLHSSGRSLEGDVQAIGVKGWLGWEIASPETWARDMKQLPTQRPAKPVIVRLRANA